VHCAVYSNELSTNRMQILITIIMFFWIFSFLSYVNIKFHCILDRNDLFFSMKVVKDINYLRICTLKMYLFSFFLSLSFSLTWSKYMFYCVTKQFCFCQVTEYVRISKTWNEKRMSSHFSLHCFWNIPKLRISDSDVRPSGENRRKRSSLTGVVEDFMDELCGRAGGSLVRNERGETGLWRGCTKG